MNHTVFLALGTNLGDRLENLRTALGNFPPEILVLEQSPIYETPPWGYLDQPAFLNQVVRLETGLSPRAVLLIAKGIETLMGRQATLRNGPRVIDLDLLFYDDLVLDLPGLTLPHPRLRGRAFVLVPLADLAPDLFHPLFGQTVRELLVEVDRQGITRFYPPDSPDEIHE